jgi:hypothetical protein
MEYVELTPAEQANGLKQEIRNLEAQHLGRVGDVTKFDELLTAREAGAFKDWDRRIMEQRAAQWSAELGAARIDAKALEISIANARRRLAAIEVPPEAE